MRGPTNSCDHFGHLQADHFGRLHRDQFGYLHCDHLAHPVTVRVELHDREHWEDEAEKLRKKLAAPAPVVVSVPCPYPGIRAFTTDDAARFHGRDSEVRELLGRLRDGQRELYVTGPSGSGKSSLVAAGLVPSLRRSPERAGGSFLVQQMRPGADPAAALAGVLEATADERGEAASACA